MNDPGAGCGELMNSHALCDPRTQQNGLPVKRPSIQRGAGLYSALGRAPLIENQYGGPIALGLLERMAVKEIIDDLRRPFLFRL